MTCPKMFAYKYRDKVESKAASESLALGSIAHAGLNATYMGTPWLAAIAKECKRFPLDGDELPDYLGRKAAGMVGAYREFYGPDLSGDLVEMPVYFRANGIPLQVHFDVGLFRGKHTLEHKTAGRLPGRNKARELATDVQARLYTMVSELVLDSGGVIYDTIVGPKLVRTAKETRETYQERIKERLLTQPDKHFHRVTLRRPDYSATLEQLTDLIDTVKFYDQHKIYPKHMRNQACYAWFRACDYLPVCSGETDLTDERLYRVRTSRRSQDNGPGTNR